MRCTIRFSADNPDQGDGYCLWCTEELRHTPAELARLRADGLASTVIDHQPRPTKRRPRLLTAARLAHAGAPGGD